MKYPAACASSPSTTTCTTLSVPYNSVAGRKSNSVPATFETHSSNHVGDDSTCGSSVVPVTPSPPAPVFRGIDTSDVARSKNFTARPDKFPVLIYIPILESSECQSVRSLINSLNAHARFALLNEVHKFPLNPVNSRHVSLSRPLFVTKRQIRPLLRSIQEEIQLIRPSSFQLADSVIAMLNQSQSRTYLVSPICGHTDAVYGLIHAMDNALSRLGLPPFFCKPVPHMSFAWSEGTELADRFLSPTHLECSSVDAGTLFTAALSYEFRSICCRVGNRIYVMNL